MKKILTAILSAALLCTAALTVSAEGYPASGASIPEGSVLVYGPRIGLEEGWGGNANAGREAAFDGDVNTFFDPLNIGDGWCGIDAGKEFILTKIVIHNRIDSELNRYNGATIQGTNTPDDEDSWTDIWMGVEDATEATWHEIEQADFDESGVGYRYFRYYNLMHHGDVAEVELYGYPVDGDLTNINVPEAAPAEAPAEGETEAPAAEETTAPETTAPETEAATEAPVVDEPEVVDQAPTTTVETPAAEAPQTFDAGIIAAAVAAVSALGYAVSKKNR